MRNPLPRRPQQADAGRRGGGRRAGGASGGAEISPPRYSRVESIGWAPARQSERGAPSTSLLSSPLIDCARRAVVHANALAPPHQRARPPRRGALHDPHPPNVVAGPLTPPRPAPPAFHHRNINPHPRRAQRSIRVSPSSRRSWSSAPGHRRAGPALLVGPRSSWRPRPRTRRCCASATRCRRRSTASTTRRGRCRPRSRPPSCGASATCSPPPRRTRSRRRMSTPRWRPSRRSSAWSRTRVILNAANARWGRPRRALRHRRALGSPPGAAGAARHGGVEETHRILDELFLLSGGKWREVTRLSVNEAEGSLDLVLGADNYGARSATNGVGAVGLQDGAQWGVQPQGRRPHLAAQNGLHCEVVVDGRPKGERAARRRRALSTSPRVGDLGDLRLRGLGVHGRRRRQVEGVRQLARADAPRPLGRWSARTASR